MTSNKRPLSTSEIILLLAAIFLGVVVTLVNISQPFVDAWSWRQTDMAVIAENFYRHSFNILYPEINWAGRSGLVGTEFQLATPVAALLYPLFGVQDWIGRSVSVLFFGVCTAFLSASQKDLE